MAARHPQRFIFLNELLAFVFDPLHSGGSDAVLLRYRGFIIGWKPGTPPTTGNETHVISLVPKPKGNQISVAWRHAPPSERVGILWCGWHPVCPGALNGHGRANMKATGASAAWRHKAKGTLPIYNMLPNDATPPFLPLFLCP